MAKRIPDGYHAVTPYLIVERPEALLTFLGEVFGAVEKERMMRPDGTIGHAETRIGDSIVMLGGADARWRPTSSALYIYVDDADAAYKRAIAAGATSLMEPADQFYGDRNAGVRDTNGISYWIATHKEDLSHDEMKRRAAASMK